MGNRYQPDLIIGILIVFFNACGALCGASFALGLGLLAAGAGAAAIPANPVAGIGLFAIGTGFAIFIAVMSLLGLVAGVGIILGKRWGLVMGACVFGIYGLGGIMSMGSDGFMTTIVNLALFAYCFCRVTGKLGPRPLS